MSFTPPLPLKSEYSGSFYHINILLPDLLESSLCNPRIIDTQQEVEKEALKTASRYTQLYRQEIAGIPRFNTPKEREELGSLGLSISKKITIGRCHLIAIDGAIILKYLQQHSLKTYDWPTPKFRS